MAWNKLAPYDKDGNLMHYASLAGTYYAAHEWREQEEFTATLMYEGFTRGRSAANMTFTDEYGHKYTMFLAEFDKLVNHMRCGCVSGTWITCKRGQNYGIRLVKAAD